MLETILTHLHNWFPVNGGKHSGTFEIVSGALAASFLQPGQYYRIRGSVFNDGLHQYVTATGADTSGSDELFGDGSGTAAESLHDETFTGEVWALAVPAAVVALADEIAAWREKNPETDKTSESFGGYSYTRGSSSENVGGGWQSVFAGRLNPYRRPYDD